MYAGSGSDGGTWYDSGGGAAMPVSACSSGLVVTALVTLLLLPAQYYVPDFVLQERSGPTPAPPAPAAITRWPDIELVYFPTLDLFFTFTLLLLGLFTYLCEWIQRKLMEKRIVKVRSFRSFILYRLWLQYKYFLTNKYCD